MEYRWWFNRMRPSDKARESTVAGYFATEATSGPGEALVREGIQNSLDARQRNQTVRVRIFVSGREQAASGREAGAFFSGLWEHLKAQDSGVGSLPKARGICPFLVFEDFGTTGLTGDPEATWPTKGHRNDFYHFFRAEGRTDKRAQDIGRWGIGKHSFLGASRIRTAFGYTVRHDGRQLLMGMAVLKSHELQGNRYMPDGWLGRPPADPEKELVRPIDDADVIRPFCHIFRLARHNEPGLSVVVPWYHEEITERCIAQSVSRQYFWPILRGELEVTVVGPQGERHLDAESLLTEIEESDVEEDILPHVHLAKWATDLPEDRLVVLNKTRTWRWEPELFPEGCISELRRRYEAGERIAMRVPVQVREKRGQARESFFDLYLQRVASDITSLPVYIRQGITIPDVRLNARAVPRGLRAIVVVEHAPLAAFVGDAENPAHTRWLKDSTNFKGKYVNGRNILDFIIRAPMGVARVLAQQETKQDRSLLLDFFSLPPTSAEPGEDKTAETSNEKPGIKPESPDVPDTRRKVRPFQVSWKDAGFVVKPNPKASSAIPSGLLIRAAYHVRRGNPFKRYKATDFDFAHEIKTTARGIKIIQKKRNTLVAKVISPEFRIELTGFDKRRDLRVDVMELEDPDAGSDV